MININDIVKFSDYKNIYLETDDCFVYKIGRKKFNIKGANVENYISPIFYKLFQPNFAFNLLENLKDKLNSERKDVEICEDNFLDILFKLYRFGLIEVLEKDNLSRKGETIMNSFEISDKKMNNIVKSKKITIVNFLNLKDIKPLLMELKEIPFNKINLINFHSDIANITNEELISLNDQNFEVTYRKNSDILNLKDNLPLSDLLITLHSAENIEINSIINRYTIESKTPWLNCIVNDEIIEIGPLVVFRKTACYDCYRYVNEDKKRENYNIYDDDNIEFPLRTYRISRRSNLYIAFGYILDEILKFFCCEDAQSTPITVDNIITINGLKLSYNIEPILKIPNCKTCGK